MITRRDGLRTAALTALSYSRVMGANGRIRGALVGCGNRGVNGLLKVAVAQEDVQMAAACDVYSPNLDKALSIMGGAGGKADSYKDYRKLVERKDIDVVIVATPDHWHSPITVAACEAGKDVYVEKPLANSIEHCLAVVDAEKKTRRIVQVGVQQRSMKIYFDALERIKSGAIGPVKRCTMVWGSDGSGRPRAIEQRTEPPEGLDWEMFQGPAPRRPYQTSRQRSWRNWWEYGSGVITDFGVHLLDVTHWFMGIDAPACCFGAGYHSPSRAPEQVPDIVAITWKYDNFLATYMSNRDLWGNTFWGEAGTLHVNRHVIVLKPFEKGPAAETKGPPGESGEQAHLRNFLDCVKSRHKPNADGETGARSTIPCLLAALSARTGKAYRYDWNGRSVKTV
jgi:predicted dehydrogenase